jgi:hypothetical protein
MAPKNLKNHKNFTFCPPPYKYSPWFELISHSFHYIFHSLLHTHNVFIQLKWNGGSTHHDVSGRHGRSHEWDSGCRCFFVIGLTLSALLMWSYLLVSSCTTWSSTMRETAATMKTITLSFPSLLYLSPTRHQLVSQLFFKWRCIWLLDWCFQTFNPTWSDICETSSTSLMYLSI